MSLCTVANTDDDANVFPSMMNCFSVEVAYKFLLVEAVD